MIRAGVVALVVAGAGFEAAPRELGFTPDAQLELRRLWTTSRDAGAERVACLAGIMDDDSMRVTRVRPLDSWADSLMISAGEALELCAPPAWLGMVHTHIAHRPDQQPYARFSGADRGVNTMWWRRWNTDGTFCVLFSEREAYCEVDGPHGLRIFPHARY